MTGIISPPEKEDTPAWMVPNKAQRQRSDYQNRLADPAHLQLFITWWTLGGPSRPPSVLELCEWPASLLHDFRYLLRRMGELTEQNKRADPEKDNSK